MHIIFLSGHKFTFATITLRGMLHVHLCIIVIIFVHLPFSLH